MTPYLRPKPEKWHPIEWKIKNQELCEQVTFILFLYHWKLMQGSVQIKLGIYTLQ